MCVECDLLEEYVCVECDLLEVCVCVCVCVCVWSVTC